MTNNELNGYLGDTVEEYYKYILDFVEWWRFREITLAGISVEKIERTDGNPITDEDQYKFSCFGRCNYSIYLSLIAAYEGKNKFREILNSVIEQGRKLPLLQDRLCTVYFNFGKALDNMGRLLCIIFNRDNLSIEQYQMMDFGRFCRDFSQQNNQYHNLNCDINNTQLKKIINIRNHLTHYWIFTYKYNQERRTYTFPYIIRTERGLIWWHVSDRGRIQVLINHQTRNVSEIFRQEIGAIDMMENDFGFIKSFLSDLYQQARIEFPNWLQRNNLRLR
jgi:hypothetical protein